VYARLRRGTSPIAISAALSLAVLLAAAAGEVGRRFATIEPAERSPQAPIEIQHFQPIMDSDGNGIPDWKEELARAGISLDASTSTETASSSDPLSEIGFDIASSLLGSYFSMKENGTYTPAQGESVARTIGNAIQAPQTFTPHSETDFKALTDVSEKAILAYRSHMREALEPLVTDSEPEFSLFARYLETSDPHWLDELSRAATRYRDAEHNLLSVSVPKTALMYHIRATNAVGAYATTLERLVRFAGDPLAVMALLRTYNDGEREFLAAFDALAQFYARSIETR